jgi:hypothetical protein
MKLHLLMYFGNIIKDIKSFTMNSQLKKDNNILIYNSELIEKLELSLEMIMEIIHPDRDENLFEKKKYLLLILEVVRLYFRLRELMGLDKIGFDFYVQKSLYLDQIVEITENEINVKLDPKE